MAIRLFDIFFSIILIMLFLPVMLVVLFLVILFIGFPPFYISLRVGKGNIEYRHLKFKSMLPGKEHGRVFFESDRITPFGRFIRRFHLDELPELFLIVIGKMSFVGPRALPQKLLKGLDTGKRTLVLPGNTGLAQIYLLKYGHISKHVQLRLDNYYEQKRSLKYNLKIIVATFYYMVKGKSLDFNPELNEDRKKFLEGENK